MAKQKGLKESVSSDFMKELFDKQESRWNAAEQFGKGLITAEQYCEISNQNMPNFIGFFDYEAKKQLSSERKETIQGFKKIVKSLLGI